MNDIDSWVRDAHYENLIQERGAILRSGLSKQNGADSGLDSLHFGEGKIVKTP